MPEREAIPDEALVVRHLRKSEFDDYNGKVIVSLNAFYDPEMSVDWLDKTSIDDSYERKPKSEAHAVLCAKDLRAVGDESVQHKPENDNYSHSEVICIAPVKNKRPLPACRAFLMKIVEAAFRPGHLREVSTQPSSDADETAILMGEASP